MQVVSIFTIGFPPIGHLAYASYKFHVATLAYIKQAVERVQEY
jgi:hypothetical protein